MAADLQSEILSASERPPPGATYLGQARLFAFSTLVFALSTLWGALLTLVVPLQVEDNLRRSGLTAQQITADKSSTLAFVVASGALVALLVPPFVGALSDRSTHSLGRRRPFMIGGILLTLVGLAVMMAPPILLVYGVGYLVMQAGSNTTVAAYSAFIPDLVPQAQRGQASGWLGMMAILGNITGLLLANLGLSLQPGQYLLTSSQQFLVYGLLIAILLGFLATTVLVMRETPLTGPRARPRFIAILHSLWIDPRRYPDFGWVWIARFLMNMGFNTIQFFLLYFLEDVVGIADQDKARYAAYLFLGLLLSGAGASMVGGRISDRAGRKPLIYVAGALMALTTIAFIIFSLLGTVRLPGLFPYPAFNTIFFLALGFGFGYGSYTAVDWALGADVLPHQDTDAAKDLGVWHIAMVLPQSLAPTLSGGLLTITTNAGLAAGPRYSLVFGVAILYFILSILAVRNVRRTC